MTAREIMRGALLACPLFLAACSTSIEVPPQTAQGLTDLRGGLVSGKAQIQRTTDAARDLTQRPQAQIEPQITRLMNEVVLLRQIATQSRTQYEAQVGESTAYFSQWDAQLKTMSDSVRKAGQDRRAESQASFETLQADMRDLRSTFRPYMEALDEASRYLKTDPTAAGVRAITPRIDEALRVEHTLMEQIDTVTAQIDKMRGSK